MGRLRKGRRGEIASDYRLGSREGGRGRGGLVKRGREGGGMGGLREGEGGGREGMGGLRGEGGDGIRFLSSYNVTSLLCSGGGR